MPLTRNPLRNRVRSSRIKPWEPYQTPTAPPSGYYDPALDSQVRAAERGFTDLRQDTEREQERAQTGLITSKGRLDETNAVSTGRLNEDFASSLAGLLRGRTRTTEDFNTGTANLDRGYKQLGARQTQGAVNQGINGGGALAAALQKRTENQGREQGAMNTQYGRAMEDSATQESGLRTSLARGLQDQERNTRYRTEDLGTDYQYGSDDRATAQGRAGRELGIFGQDIGAQRFFQATQAGFSPPGRGEPGGQASNEFGSGAGARRLITRGNTVYVYGPNGKLITTRRKAAR